MVAKKTLNIPRLMSLVKEPGSSIALESYTRGVLNIEATFPLQISGEKEIFNEETGMTLHTHAMKIPAAQEVQLRQQASASALKQAVNLDHFSVVHSQDAEAEFTWSIRLEALDPVEC